MRSGARGSANAAVPTATSDGTPQPFFTSGEATTFALGLNAVKDTAQLYAATLFLEGFTFTRFNGSKITV